MAYKRPEIYFGGPIVLEEQNKGTAVKGIIPLYRDPQEFADFAVAEFKNREFTPDSPLLDGLSTDAIIRARDLLTNDMDELGDRALRGLPQGHEMKLGDLRRLEGRVLVAGFEFGKGSSREQAVWALLAAGISAVIARSFGSIFKDNSAYLVLHLTTRMDLAPRIEKGEAIPLEDFLQDYAPMHQEIIKAGGLFRYLKQIREGQRAEPRISTDPGRPMNIYEQRVARALGAAAVKPEDYALLTPNLIFSYVGLSGLARQVLRRECGEVAKRYPSENILLFTDHFRYPDPLLPTISKLSDEQRGFAAELEIPHENYYGETRGGICHSEVKDLRDPRKCEVILGTDSHTSTSGSRPVLAIPVGSSLFGAVVAERRIPYSVGKTLRVELRGELPWGVSIREAQLQWAAKFRERVQREKITDIPTGVEIVGDGLDKLSLEQMEAICNMVPEIWLGEVAVTAPFTAGVRHLMEKWGMNEEEAIRLYGYPQPGCRYAIEEEYDLGQAVPGVALPGSPSNFVSLEVLAEHPEVDIAFIGSCTNGYEALEEAAAVLMGRAISERTKLVIVPSSPVVLAKAKGSGVWDELKRSGATVEEVSACSVCIGNSPHTPKSGQVGFSASNRNFPGRMGDLNSRSYLGSPVLTALTALKGRIPTAGEYRNEMERVYDNLKLIKEKRVG